MATGASISNYLEEKWLNLVLNGVAYAAPTGLTLHLYTAAPSDVGGGTEVVGGTYAAKACTTSFAVWADGVVSNDVAIDFGTATADWGLITHFGVKDQLGNLLFWAALMNQKNIAFGDGANFAIGTLTAALD